MIHAGNLTSERSTTGFDPLLGFRVRFWFAFWSRLQFSVGFRSTFRPGLIQSSLRFWFGFWSIFRPVLNEQIMVQFFAGFFRFLVEIWSLFRSVLIQLTSDSVTGHTDYGRKISGPCWSRYNHELELLNTEKCRIVYFVTNCSCNVLYPIYN